MFPKGFAVGFCLFQNPTSFKIFAPFFRLAFFEYKSVAEQRQIYVVLYFFDFGEGKARIFCNKPFRNRPNVVFYRVFVVAR
jgi:hypothetical protein